MDNIDILTDYINSYENPREFMNLLFALLKPKPRVENCADAENDIELTSSHGKGGAA